jgi:division protein CdvB (Snf7/Vps24/ESCRT-III family)
VPRIEAVRNNLLNQISRLDRVTSELKSKDDKIVQSMVLAVREKNVQYSAVLSSEMVTSRSLCKSAYIAKVTLEKLLIKIGSVSNFGDIVIVLSPALAVVKILRALLTPSLPDTDQDLGIISELLGSILLDAGQVGGYTINFETANEEAARLVDDASLIAAKKIKEEFDNLPDLASLIPSGLT